MDHYATLGLPRTATPEQIRKSYLSIAKTHHPDKTVDRDKNNKFKQALDAYTTLMDADRRRTYDSTLSAPESQRTKQNARRRTANTAPKFCARPTGVNPTTQSTTGRRRRSNFASIFDNLFFGSQTSGFCDPAQTRPLNNPSVFGQYPYGYSTFDNPFTYFASASTIFGADSDSSRGTTSGFKFPFYESNQDYIRNHQAEAKNEKKPKKEEQKKNEKEGEAERKRIEREAERILREKERELKAHEAELRDSLQREKDFLKRQEIATERQRLAEQKLQEQRKLEQELEKEINKAKNTASEPEVILISDDEEQEATSYINPGNDDKNPLSPSAYSCQSDVNYGSNTIINEASETSNSTETKNNLYSTVPNLSSELKRSAGNSVKYPRNSYTANELNSFNTSKEDQTEVVDERSQTPNGRQVKSTCSPIKKRTRSNDLNDESATFNGSSSTFKKVRVPPTTAEYSYNATASTINNYPVASATGFTTAKNNSDSDVSINTELMNKCLSGTNRELFEETLLDHFTEQSYTILNHEEQLEKLTDIKMEIITTMNKRLLKDIQYQLHLQNHLLTMRRLQEIDMKLLANLQKINLMISEWFSRYQ